MVDNKCGTRFCAPALGLAFGIACGLFMMLFAWAGWLWNYGNALTTQYSLVYYGYAPTLLGGLIGGFWGFLEGLIFGLIVGWMYNAVARCCRCEACCGVTEVKVTKKVR
jgi:hypothetical protein